MGQVRERSGKPAIEPAARKRKIRWGRITLAVVCGLVVLGLAAGGGFYLWFRAQVGAANQRVDPGVVQALNERVPSTSTPSTGSASTTTTIAAPTGMNIVLLGSDTRSSLGTAGRSDTIILVHVDPEKNFLSMLSIPRDLRVAIPGHGINKINTAYRFGGPALLVRTIQSVFGVDLDHYVEVDFNAFKQITDSLGGVYLDVDRTYDDGKIQFEPGYQLANGSQALGYVRTRHDNNYDFGRMERQQRFINAVREQAMGWNLPLKLPGLVKALFDNVDTDLGANEFLKLAYWGVKLPGTRMRMAKIVGSVQTIDGTSYVIATDQQIKNAVTDFFTEPGAVETDKDLPAPAKTARLAVTDLSGVKVSIVNGTGRLGQGALASAWLTRQGATVSSVTKADTPVEGGAVVTYPSGKAETAKAVARVLGASMTRQGKSKQITLTLGKEYAIAPGDVPAPATVAASSTPVPNMQEWQALAAQAGFPLVAPAFVPAACTYSFQRSYSIESGKNLPAVRVGYQYQSKDKYLGFSETTWLDAPIASPGREVTGPGGIVFTLVGTVTKPDHVWWKEDGVLRWVSNTLTCDLKREELLATAMSAVRVVAAQPATTATTGAPTTTGQPATTGTTVLPTTTATTAQPTTTASPTTASTATTATTAQSALQTARSGAQ